MRKVTVRPWPLAKCISGLCSPLRSLCGRPDGMGLARFADTDFVYPTCLDDEKGLTREVYRAWLEALIDSRTGVNPRPFRPCVFDQPGDGQSNKWPPFNSTMRSTVRSAVLGSDWGLDDSTSFSYPPRSWQADQGKVRVAMADGTEALLSIPTRVCAQLLYRQRAIFNEFCQEIVGAWDAGHDGKTLGYRPVHQAKLPCGCFLWARRKTWQRPATVTAPTQQPRARRTSAPGPVPTSLRPAPSMNPRPVSMAPPAANQLPTGFPARRPATPSSSAPGQARMRAVSGGLGARPGAGQGAASRPDLVSRAAAGPQYRQDPAAQARLPHGDTSATLDRARAVLQRRRSQGPRPCCSLTVATDPREQRPCRAVLRAAKAVALVRGSLGPRISLISRQFPSQTSRASSLGCRHQVPNVLSLAPSPR